MAPGAITTSLTLKRERAKLGLRRRPSESLARLVAARRGELGLTQSELADRMGAPVSAVSRIESGLHAPQFGVLERLFRALESRLVVGYETGPAEAPTEGEAVVVEDSGACVRTREVRGRPVRRLPARRRWR